MQYDKTGLEDPTDTEMDTGVINYCFACDEGYYPQTTSLATLEAMTEAEYKNPQILPYMFTSCEGSSIASDANCAYWGVSVPSDTVILFF